MSNPDILPEGWFEPSDGLILAAATNAAPDGALVEVGVYRGRSAHIICDSRHGRKLYLFDTFAMEGANPHEWPVGKGVFHNFIDPRDCPWDLPIALLHQDADHTEPVVRAHLDRFAPFIMANGIIALHDYFGEAYPGVKQAWLTWPEAEKYELFLQGGSLACWRRKV